MRGVTLVAMSVLMNLVAVGLLPALGVRSIRPELPLIVAVYVGLATGRRRLASAKESIVTTTLIGLAIGYFSDLAAGAPLGLGASACLLATLLARSLADRLLVGAWWREGLLVFVFALVYGAAVLVLGGPFFAGAIGKLTRAWLSSAIASAIVAPVAFALLGRLDRLIDPSAIDSTIVGSQRLT